jgi:hypothetical protein
MTGDRYLPLTAAAVLLVAAIAAVVSYMHVATLALEHGQRPLAAYLLPLSIDGLVATSSLVLLRSARAGVSAPWLARTGLVLAVVATLAANVASGAAHGCTAGWLACGRLRDKRGDGHRDVAAPGGQGGHGAASGHGPQAATGGQAASGHRYGSRGPVRAGGQPGHDQRRAGRGHRHITADGAPSPRAPGQRTHNPISPGPVAPSLPRTRRPARVSPEGGHQNVNPTE